MQNSLIRKLCFLLVTTSLHAWGADEISLDAMKAKAEAGKSSSEYQLGKLYLRGGNGITPDIGEAIKWLKRADNHGNYMASFLLAQAYENGEGVPQNSAEALKLMHKAAEHNVVGAQYALGVRYTLGKETAKDYKEAVKWYRKAAEKGLAEAQLSLGLRYARGEGTEVNDAEAAKWFKRAADQGVHDGQLQMAQRCSTGEGVKKDLVEAYKWSTIIGEEWLRKKIGKQMKPAEIAEAEKRASAFTPLLELDPEEEPESNSWLWLGGGGLAAFYALAIGFWLQKRRKTMVQPATVAAS